MPQLIRALAMATLLLAACQPAPAPQGAFRNTAVPIYSNATFDMGRLPGTWSQAAAFAAAPASCAGPTGLSVAADGSARYRLCLDGRPAQGAGPLTPAGPGRFRIPGDAAGDWWVVWVDTGYRTLAIGTPSGAFGFILNRDGPLPPDRLAAAAEIFDFNGYDAARLVPVR